MQPSRNSVSAELQARRAINRFTTTGLRLACDSMARRVRMDDYSSATYGEIEHWRKKKSPFPASVDV
jgi:hypothetical protein